MKTLIKELEHFESKINNKTITAREETAYESLVNFLTKTLDL